MGESRRSRPRCRVRTTIRRGYPSARQTRPRPESLAPGLRSAVLSAPPSRANPCHYPGFRKSLHAPRNPLHRTAPARPRPADAVPGRRGGRPSEAGHRCLVRARVRGGSGGPCRDLTLLPMAPERIVAVRAILACCPAAVRNYSEAGEPLGTDDPARLTRPHRTLVYGPKTILQQPPLRPRCRRCRPAPGPRPSHQCARVGGAAPYIPTPHSRSLAPTGQTNWL